MRSPNPNRIIFDIAKEVYEQDLPKEDGINKLVQELNMNRGSAQMIIVQIFPKLLDGRKFTRTLSVALFDSILKYIREDYGDESLKRALSALKMHIDYIKEKGDPKIKLRKVYQRYLDDLLIIDKPSAEDEKEQEEISGYLKKNKTRDELLNELSDELKNSENDTSGKVTVNHKSYKRNNKIIVLIKILRNSECQICGHSILKKDGSKYIEAAHIVPKHKGGNESRENIILLCPNHHKEFDLGTREITKHNKDKIEFKLNENSYRLSLTIK